MENDWKNDGFRFYCLGLTSKEIAKLLNKSYRTIQGAMSADDWKGKRQVLRTRNDMKIYRKVKKALQKK